MSLFIWIQRGYNSHSKVPQKNFAPPGVLFAPPPGGAKNTLGAKIVGALRAPKVCPPWAKFCIRPWFLYIILENYKMF